MDAAALEEEIKVAGLMDLVIKYHADEKVQLQIHAWNLPCYQKSAAILYTAGISCHTVQFMCLWRGVVRFYMTPKHAKCRLRTCACDFFKLARGTRKRRSKCSKPTLTGAKRIKCLKFDTRLVNMHTRTQARTSSRITTTP